MLNLKIIQADGGISATCTYEGIEQTLNYLQSLPQVTLPATLLSALPKRQLDFLLGRHCAALALTQLQAASTHVAIAANRAPLWPQGFVGSLSHCPGLAAALVCPDSTVQGVGIDWERRDANPNPRITSHIITPAEEALLASHYAPADALLIAFSTKESLYKCLNPLAGLFFGFKDACIREVHKNHLVCQVIKELPNVGKPTLNIHFRLNERFIYAETRLQHESH